MRRSQKLQRSAPCSGSAAVRTIGTRVAKLRDVMWSVICLVANLAAAQPAAAAARHWELSLGASELLYFAALSGGLSTAAELALEHPLYGPLRAGAGARLGLAPVAPEVFMRLSARVELSRWRPSAGIELGVTARGHYESADGLLGELRRTSRSDLVPLYIAWVAAPLRFALGARWTLSALELHVGTHLAPLGRYVRLQVGLVSLGVNL